MEQLDAIAQVLRHAKSVVVLTGAGVSAESGIPTFRGAMEGHWSKYSPQELATPEAFARDPQRVAQWYDERRLKALACQPNAGHFALAKIQEALLNNGASFTLLTQNVDQLHQRAGSTDVVEIHGSIVKWRCTKTHTSDEFYDPEPFETHPLPTPYGGVYRPDVVWFGEPLKTEDLALAKGMCLDCDVYMAIGTSAVVYPATGFISYAIDAGATTIEINPAETILSSEFSHSVRETSGDFLPELYEAAFG